MKVLIGIDGSELSFHAAQFACRLITAARDQLVLYYAPPETSVRSSSAGNEAIVERARRALSEPLFREAKSRLPQELADGAIELVGAEQPAHGLLLAAQQEQVQMIVLGARGAGPMPHRPLGAVGRAVAHSAQAPVLLVRPTGEEPNAEAPLRILLARDPAEVCRAAASLLNQWTLPPKTVGRVMTVVPTLFAGEVPAWLEEAARRSDEEAMARAWVEHRDAQQQQVRNQLAQFATTLPDAFQHHLPIVCDGHPAQQIERVIERERISLVAVGARSRGAVSRFLLGSVSEQILTHAPCSVLIARQSPVD